jgi:hypothetical protein
LWGEQTAVKHNMSASYMLGKSKDMEIIDEWSTLGTFLQEKGLY